jgi:hypothetical protein
VAVFDRSGSRGLLGHGETGLVLGACAREQAYLVTRTYGAAVAFTASQIAHGEKYLSRVSKAALVE